MLYDNDTFRRNGRTFKVTFPFDDSHGAPWKEEDGHGMVSDWTTRGKAPGERVLAEDRRSKRYYDMQETMRIARRDGWGLSADETAKLAKRLGRTPTKGDVIAQAVENDFQFLRGWCNDDWQYVGVVVCHVDEDGEEHGESESLWGVESSSGDYLETVAHELADEINSRLDSAMAADIAASRPDMQLRESDQ